MNTAAEILMARKSLGGHDANPQHFILFIIAIATAWHTTQAFVGK